MIGLNHVPVITASDVELYVGDTFDVMNGVKASDTEDGDVTNKVTVIKNTVDVTKAGTYQVTYEVTDSEGVSVQKTINITVKEKAPIDTPNSSDDSNDKPNDSKDNQTDDNKNTSNNKKEEKEGIDTGVNTNTFGLSTLFLLSGAGIILAVNKRRKHSSK